MYDVLFWWFAAGFIGASTIFYEDLRDRLKYGDAEINLGELVTYFGMSILGPVVLYIAIKEADLFKILGDLFEDSVSRLSEIKVYTFKKRGE